MSNILSFRLLGSCTAAAALAAFAFTGACGSSSDTARNSGGSAGAGTAGSSGSNSTAGASGTNSTAGASGSGTAGASTCTETNTTDVCDTAVPNLYSAPPSAAPTCGKTILALPGAMSTQTYWFSYGDATPNATPTANIGAGEKCGCGGPTDCAFHAVGQGFADYGAGIGFDVNEDTANNNTALPYDASAYNGLRLWARGTTTGTRGKGYSDSDNTIHIKLVTATDRHGDDYGSYCVIGADWTECDVPFTTTGLYRDGFCTSSSTNPCTDPALDTFDKNQLLKVQIEFSEHTATDADGGMTKESVSFDVWVDDISLYM